MLSSVFSVMLLFCLVMVVGGVMLVMDEREVKEII